jgi:RNA polymerase sigma-70 factor, ECF subfamily
MATADVGIPHQPGGHERQWLAGVRAGDERTFESLFRAHYPALCRYVAGLVQSEAGAEDIVQQVFMRLWERHPTWSPASGVRAYLFAACRNRALDHLKHQRIVERTAEGARLGLHVIPTVGRGSAPVEDVQLRQLQDALRQTVQAMPERRRAVFVLRWEHGLDYAEIGKVLGITPKSAEVQFGRGVKEIRAALELYRS